MNLTACPTSPLRAPQVALCAAIAAALLVAPPSRANPQGAQVNHGQATFEASGPRLTIRNSPGAAISWQSFSVLAGETTHFQQQSQSSSVLNRVVGNQPSQLLGSLTSNGRLVLINQNGIAVGAGAVIDTAGFTASTMRISERDWAHGKLRFEESGSGGIQVDGAIRSQGGDIVLLAPHIGVGEAGLVRADGGSVILGAGQKAEVTGRGLEGIRMEVRSPNFKVTNLGLLKGDAVGIFAGTLHHSGAIIARTASQDGGRVVLKAIDLASLGLSSRIDADAGEGKKGGSITVWSDGSTSALGSLSARGGTVVIDPGGQLTKALKQSDHLMPAFATQLAASTARQSEDRKDKTLRAHLVLTDHSCRRT